MAKSKQPKDEAGTPVEFTEKELQAQADERSIREAEVDAETSNRTSRYDQDLKERARTYGINPDNFDTEESLGAAVRKHEEDNNILGTPEEGDQ